jgi:hypothetical protein
VPRATLLLPARAALAGVALPDGVAIALGRGDRNEGEAGRRAQLQRHFEWLPRTWPVAALAREHDAGDAASGQWLRADPAWIRPDINGARLFATGDGLRLGQADVDALLPALRPLFGDAGMPIDAPHPSRWYLRIAEGVALPSFPDPADALGADLGDALVEGADDANARRWRALLSEAQVVLHNHPWNARRAAEGKPPVNSLWFWGGGALPDRVATRHSGVASDDVVLRGLAARAGLDPHACPEGFAMPHGGDALLDAGANADAGALLARWLQPALQALRHGDLEALALDFADGVHFDLRARQRWRLWRRPLRSLA